MEATAVEEVALESISERDAVRAGAASREDLLAGLAHHAERPVFRVGLRFAGADPRIALREQAELSDEQHAQLVGRLPRLDRSSPHGPWTHMTLATIARHPATRAAEHGRTFAGQPPRLGVLLQRVDVGRGREELFGDQLPELLRSLAESARVASIRASNAIEGIDVGADRGLAAAARRRPPARRAIARFQYARRLMSEEIRELLLDLPLVDTPDRPEGTIVIRRSEVPHERRREADEFVIENGGLIGEKPILEVIGGRTPAGGGAGERFYAVPIAALVAR